ncbi:hypothetical protein [Brevibacterium sandarakinum]|uniref:hypothetical protein n=1 Tax=Brevibacterium sandarakinum TaxID=629680 RepID=UPI000B858D28|nr:hypothetical protein [Brevibacterium sandarakinum]
MSEGWNAHRLPNPPSTDPAASAPNRPRSPQPHPVWLSRSLLWAALLIDFVPILVTTPILISGTGTGICIIVQALAMVLTFAGLALPPSRQNSFSHRPNARPAASVRRIRRARPLNGQAHQPVSYGTGHAQPGAHAGPEANQSAHNRWQPSQQPPWHEKLL